MTTLSFLLLGIIPTAVIFILWYIIVWEDKYQPLHLQWPIAIKWAINIILTCVTILCWIILFCKFYGE